MSREETLAKLAAAAEAAGQREAARAQLAEEQRLEELRQASDWFFLQLPEALKASGAAQMSIDERDYVHNRQAQRFEATAGSVAEFVIAQCQAMGLKCEVSVDSDTVGYSVRTSAHVAVTLQ